MDEMTEKQILLLAYAHIFVSYLVTNTFIISGVIRHWNDVPTQRLLYSINQSKKNILDNDADAERGYPPYIINRCLSSFTDTILFVNELNKNPHLPKKLQYDFLLNSVKPRKRFSPWARKDSIDYLELVKEYYGYNDDKALQALRILNKDQLDTIKKALSKGGKYER